MIFRRLHPGARCPWAPESATAADRTSNPLPVRPAALSGHVVATSYTSALRGRSRAAFLEHDVATATSRISHLPLTAIAFVRRVRLEATP